MGKMKMKSVNEGGMENRKTRKCEQGNQRGSKTAEESSLNAQTIWQWNEATAQIRSRSNQRADENQMH